jgi:hypothetical protein
MQSQSAQHSLLDLLSQMSLLDGLQSLLADARQPSMATVSTQVPDRQAEHLSQSSLLWSGSALVDRWERIIGQVYYRTMYQASPYTKVNYAPSDYEKSSWTGLLGQYGLPSRRVL